MMWWPFLMDKRHCWRRGNRVPVLILSDVMMPKLDGFGLLQAVRTDASLASVPVVLLSARAGEEAILEGIRAGADEYLIKPFSARELIARVDAQIQRKQFERQLAAAEQRLQAALAAAKMAVLEWDPVADTITTVGTVTDVFGISPGHTLRSRSLIFDLVHPDDLDRYLLTVRQRPAAAKVFKAIFELSVLERAAWRGWRNAVIPSKILSRDGREWSAWSWMSPNGRRPRSR